MFWESLPIPPVKIVEGGRLRADIEDCYLRRSRVPKLVGLDLRAKIGANNVAHERLTALVDKYGADTVKAVMKKMMSDAETRLRDQLRRAARRRLVGGRPPGRRPGGRPGRSTRSS